MCVCMCDLSHFWQWFYFEFNIKTPTDILSYMFQFSGHPYTHVCTNIWIDSFLAVFLKQLLTPGYVLRHMYSVHFIGGVSNL